MPEQPLPGPAPSGVPASLHAVAQVLRQSPPLGPEAQRALAGLLDELGNALGSAPVPPAEVTHLADSTAHFLQAVHHRHAPGMLAAARGRLEAAIVGAEVQTPLLAGFAQRVLDALANIGI